MGDGNLEIKIGRLEGQTNEMSKQLDNMQEKVDGTHSLINKMRREILQEVNRMHQTCPIVDGFTKHINAHNEIEKEHRQTVAKLVVMIFASFVLGGMSLIWNLMMKFTKVNH